MTSHAVTATPRTTVREAANLLRGRTIGCLPVVDKRKLVGIVTITDLLELLGRGAEHPVPGHGELAMGAVAWNGVRVLNEDVVHHLRVSREAIERIVGEELREVKRREAVFREGAAPIDITGKTVILVDDGLATGATMRAAVLAVRQESLLATR